MLGKWEKWEQVGQWGANVRGRCGKVGPLEASGVSGSNWRIKMEDNWGRRCGSLYTCVCGKVYHQQTPTHDTLLPRRYHIPCILYTF